MEFESKELLVKGTRLLRQGKAAEAASFLSQAHQIDPDNFDVKLNLAGALILLGKYKKAIPLLENLVGGGQANRAVWTNLGAAYLGNPALAKDEDQKKAITAFRSALESDPEAPHAAYNIALIHLARGEYDLAAGWFREALRVDPDDRDAKSYLGKIRSLVDATDEDSS